MSNQNVFFIDSDIKFSLDSCTTMKLNLTQVKFMFTRISVELFKALANIKQVLSCSCLRQKGNKSKMWLAKWIISQLQGARTLELYFCVFPVCRTKNALIVNYNCKRARFIIACIRWSWSFQLRMALVLVI